MLRLPATQLAMRVFVSHILGQTFTPTKSTTYIFSSQQKHAKHKNVKTSYDNKVLEATRRFRKIRACYIEHVHCRVWLAPMHLDYGDVTKLGRRAIAKQLIKDLFSFRVMYCL